MNYQNTANKNIAAECRNHRAIHTCLEIIKIEKIKLSVLSDAVIMCIGTTKDCSDKLPFLPDIRSRNYCVFLGPSPKQMTK